MNIPDNTDLMKEMVTKVLTELITSELTPHESMYVLAHMLASGFFADELNRDEAAARFATVTDMVYTKLESMGV